MIDKSINNDYKELFLPEFDHDKDPQRINITYNKGVIRYQREDFSWQIQVEISVKLQF